MPCSVRSERKCRSAKRRASPLPPCRRASLHCRCASSTARWSDCSLLKVACTRRASSRRANGCRKGERSESAAAMRSTGCAQRSIAPYTRRRPTAISVGSAARWRPSGVSASSASSAPVRCSEATAAVTATSGGVSIMRAIAPRSGISASSGARRSCRQTSCSGPRSISGVRAACISCVCRQLVYSLKLWPARTRPARPARWRASACEIHTSTRRRICLRSSNMLCFARPLSMTKTASSMVIEVSAMLVASTTLRAPGGVGSKILACMSLGRLA
mmetsp:Transcript_6565/g.16245  ORF Transcript_6565/g.16245 Transcript_6565/m.16245 type:complete len:274 (-) Transcript_6565:533-1354(-)